jgi:3-methyladenine DNA glycosylase AlkD
MNTFTQNLRTHFEKHANPINALPMQKYMKDTSTFLGIKSPDRVALFKKFIKENPPPQYSEVLDIVKELWAMPHRELHYCAIDLLFMQRKNYQKEDYLIFEKLITQNSWWDSVDSINSNILGYYFKKFPEQIRPVTERWMESNNMWLQRVCLIFQLTYRKETDFALMTDYILVLSESKEFFIQKAIGWALRQYARTNPQAVRHFVENNPLKPLSIREALKHIG